MALCELVGLERGELNAHPQPDEENSQQVKICRDAKFRFAVVAAYGYTCALTGYRLVTITGKAIVDAARVHQFASSRSNDIQNGFALSKNAHWLFDNGLWSIDRQYRVMVAKSIFSEHHPDRLGLLTYEGREIRLPKDKTRWPSQEYLEWHRTNCFESTADA